MTSSSVASCLRCLHSSHPYSLPTFFQLFFAAVGGSYVLDV